MAKVESSDHKLIAHFFFLHWPLTVVFAAHSHILLSPPPPRRMTLPSHRTQTNWRQQFTPLLVVLVTLLSFTRAFTIHPDLGSITPTAISWATYLASHPANAPPPATASPDAIHITLLHINDLYELMPSGSLGGVARLKTIAATLEQNNKGNTVSFLAGDLFSPSALSTVPIASLGGKSFNGKQMVATMNAFGLSYATLGNHETDVSASDYAARMNESQFRWLCSNSAQSTPNLFAWEETTFSKNLSWYAKVGIFGLTLDSNNKPYQSYANFTTSLDIALQTVNEMEGQDMIIALTHLPYYHDQTLVSTVSGIDIVLGGHEHTRMQIIDPAGKLPPIYKADSNVHSCWIHDLWIDPSQPRGNPQRLVIDSNLIVIDETVPTDPALNASIGVWVNEGFQGFTDAGFAPTDFLATVTEDLVGTNEVIFAQDTILTQLFNLACLEECIKYNTDTFTVPPIDGTIFNSGAIRIDDTIPAGTSMIQYDAIRISPYLNPVVVVNMTGALLQQTLDASQSRVNNSQMLHFYPNVTVTATGGYLINGQPLVNSTTKWYIFGVLQYLLQGKDPYEFLELSPTNLQIRLVAGDASPNVTAALGDAPTADVRRSLIDQIALRYPSTPTPPPGPDPPGPDGPLTILGLKVWIFVLVVIGLALALTCLIVGCIRHVRHHHGGGWSKKNDDIADQRRKFLETDQYSTNNDIYSTEDV